MEMNVKIGKELRVVPGVKWHPAWTSHTVMGDTEWPGGLWTTGDNLRLHGIDPEGSDMVSEAPLEVYADTDDGTPWHNFGTLIQVIHPE